jgi:putative YhdH/YhfP family quinone oxidoreductase
MHRIKFKTIVTNEVDGRYVTNLKSKSISDLPEGDIIINVKYSSLNYKDALSSIGNKGVTRKYPHTPGIDAAGVVADSKSDKFKVGDEVIVTGFDLGMNTSGGFAEYIRIPAEWAMPLPNNLSLKESMIYGTAGFTAALSLFKLEEFNLIDNSKEILVTGATGAVGSMAVSILSKAGYKAVAATGKTDKEDFLKNIGANKVIDRKEVDDDSKRPLLRPRWGGVIDTVGGNILATALKTTDYSKGVTTCGLTQSIELNTTVFPFILKGVCLIGIDSVECPMDIRKKVWSKISTDWKVDVLNEISTEISLEDVPKYLEKILAGQNVGKVVVNIG